MGRARSGPSIWAGGLTKFRAGSLRLGTEAGDMGREERRARRARYALRASGIVMQRGPPRPRESSLPERRTAIRASEAGAESP